MITAHHKQFHFQFLTSQIWATFNPADGQSSASNAMEHIFQEIKDNKIDMGHFIKSVVSASAMSDNVTNDEVFLVNKVLSVLKVESEKTPLRRMQDAVINAMTDLLWEHREYLDSIGGSSNSIEYIDDDLDLIDIAYYGREADGDRQEELTNEGLANTFTFADAFELLHTRMTNSGLFER